MKSVQKCVHKGSEFKKLAKDNNISENFLEPLIYKYWQLTQNEEVFPTNIYIQAQIGNVTYKESSDNVRKLWQKKYNKAQVFNTIEELEAAKREASRFFPENAIVNYKDAENKQVLVVKKPVASVNKNFDNFFVDNDVANTEHFNEKFNDEERGILFDIIDSKVRTYQFTEEEEIKKSLKELLQKTTLSQDTIKKVSDKIDSLTKNKILSELNTLSREQQDFELVSGNRFKEPKENIVFEKTSKNTATPEIQFAVGNSKSVFTFDDGTKIEAPFELNNQQKDALNAMNAFIKSDEKTMTLSGYAGTGKTSLMELLAKKMKAANKHVAFCATTNKAAGELGKRVKKAGFDASTLFKLFNINLEMDENKPYNADNLIPIFEEADIDAGTTVIIDEASMMNENSYKIIKKAAEDFDLKIIFVGDPMQLPPVKEDKKSIVFRNRDGKVIELTKVERTGDNAILEEATRLREGEKLTKESSFNKNGEGVAYIDVKNKENIDRVIKHYIPGLYKNPDYFRILAYTNKAVTSYNETVRELLGYKDPTPRVGEPIVGYANWGRQYNRKTKQTTYKFINSEAYEVTRVGVQKPIDYYYDGKRITLMAIPIQIKDSLGKEQIINFIDIKNNAANREAATILANKKTELFEMKKRAFTKREKAIINQDINAIEEFLFVNDDIKSADKKRTLQRKVFDFGYSMTIHKSQGSTFSNVLIDDIDVNKSAINDSSSWESVGIDFDEEGPDFEHSVQVGEGEEVDLSAFFGEDDYNMISEAPKPEKVESEEIDTPRQLRYVAVTRATDTVTIITNNVKKEDSPLNHVVNKSNNAPIKAPQAPKTTIKEDNSRSENKDAKYIAATISPYYKTTYDNYVKMSKEEQDKMRNSFANAAKRMASILGISLNMKEASFNIGGYQFEDGGSIIEPSFTFRLNTTPEKARLFAALMGEFGFEQQEATVSNYDIDNYDEADGERFSLEIKDSNAVLDLVKKYDIKNFTFDKTRGIFSVLSFDNADVDKFHKLVKDLKEKGYETKTKSTPFKSSYDTPVRREALYREWLDSRGDDTKGEEQLNNLVQKATETVSKLIYYQGTPTSYEGKVTPKKDTIFVFGSNPKGIHGAGAAYTAVQQFGAKYYQGEGMQGNAYAIPTKDLDKAKGTRWYRPGKKEEADIKQWYETHAYSEVQNHPLNAERSISPQEIIESIKKFYDVAKNNPEKKFHVSHYPLGEISLNGYIGEEMREMFIQAGPIPNNVIFNKEWTDSWPKESNTQTSQEFTKVNRAFGEVLISHLEKDDLKGYERILSRKALVNLAKTLFDFFEKNNIKIVITNAPYSDAEKEVGSSVVAMHNNYAAIYYQDGELQGGKYLNILHELLHIATRQAMPFDAEGRAIEDENLQTYYDMFQRKLMEDAEWKDIQNFKYNPSQYVDKVSNRARILSHALYSAGEFVSMFVSNKEVQDVLTSITIGETQTSSLWEEMRKWCKRLLEKIFHGNSYIQQDTVLDDITNFLLTTEFSATYDSPVLEGKEKEDYNKYVQGLEDRYNKAIDFKNPHNNIEGNAQQNLPGPETKINIYAGTNENADLSNFAERPFTSESPLTGTNVTYKTVEGAFQAAKLGYTNLPTEEIADVETRLMEATGPQARSIGRSIKGLNTEEWDKNSSRIMKALLKASFEQNPKALQRLLVTGDATLTHTQDKDKWGTEFPKLLMEVRKELRNEHPELAFQQSIQQSQQQQPQSQLVLEHKDDRYHYKESASTNAFNKAANALRNAGWHVEFYNKQSRDGLYTNDTMTISFEGFPEKGFFEIVKDLEDDYYSVHFKTKSAKTNNDTIFASEALTDAEKDALFEAVAYSIPEGGKLSTWGELSEGGISGLNRFKYLGFIQADSRQVKMKKGGKKISIPVLTKNSNSRLTQQVLEHWGNATGESPFFLEDMKEYLRDNGYDNIERALEEERELQEIKAKAQADGTFMLAPNGKPTNLNERQWLQVRTKAFKEWFGDWEKIAPKLQISDDKKLKDILQNIADSNSRFSTLAQFILDNHLSPRDLGEVLIDNDFPMVNQHGWYREQDDYWAGTIRYIGFQANNVPEETFNGAILHEIMHSLTHRLLKNYKENPDSVPENIRSSIKKLYEIIDYSKKYILDNYNPKEGPDREKLLSLVKRQNFDKGYLHKMFYAFDETSNPESEHIDEFISEIFTNPAFQEILNSIPYKETKQTLWDKIKECIQAIFGIPINKGSVLEESLKVSTEFINKAKKEYDSVSKVVDENGEPLVVYHNTENEFTKFSKFRAFLATLTGSNIFGNGFYFSNQKGTSLGAINMPVFLSVVNPSDGDMTSKNDGMIHSFGNGEVWYAAKKPNQIKSATANNGMFSRENDDIQAMLEESNKGLNTALDIIDDAIKTGNWTEEASKELDTLINDIENEEKVYNRFLLRNQQNGFRKGGRIYETASIILGRSEEANRKESSNKGGERKETLLERVHRREKESKEQEKLIETWAKSQDLWLNDYEDPDGNKASSLEDLMDSQWHYLDRGSESSVYLYDQDTVIKTINLSHYDNNLMRTMDKIALHNTMSPSTALEVVGFGRDSLGHFQIIALQPYIQGEELTNAEFEEFKKKLQSTEEEGWHYVDNYKVTDLAPYNIKKYHDEITKEDVYFVVDSDYWIDLEDFEIDNSVSAKTLTADKTSSKESTKDSEIPFYLLRTATGEVEIYGFVTPEGDTYFDETKIDLEHPFHEYTHLWDRAIIDRNESLWDKGVSLLKQLDLWNDILNNKDYGQKWIKDGKSGKELENLIASEVHARLVGKEGAKRLEEIAKKQGNKGIIEKLKQWMLDVWKELKATFSDWSPEEIAALTLEDFNEMTLRDFANINLKAPQAPSNVVTPQDDATAVMGTPKEIKTKLSNYAHLKGLQEDFTIDAEWKVPLLKDWDEQLGNDNTEEDTENILEEMDRIMKAASKEDYDNPTTENAEIQKTLSGYDRINTQLDNLLDSDEITAFEVRHVAELVVNSISDTITRLQSEIGAAEELFPTLKTELDFRTASRKEIVETVGINELVRVAKERFDPSVNTNMEDIDCIIQSELLIENWDAIILLASDVFAANEGFGASFNYNTGKFETTETPDIQFDNFDENSDPDSMRENEDEQEHWQVESRTIDILNSMSQLVRMRLHQCYLKNKDGSKVLSKWGIPERVNPRKAVNNILRWTQGALSLNDMIAKLTEKKEQNPWLGQLIEWLSDTSGNETDFQSQFYGVFEKHFQLYSIVRYEDKSYYSMLVNKHPALTEAMNTINALIKMQEHPLFKNGGIDKEVLGNKNTVNSKKVNLYRELITLSSINDRFKKGAEVSKEDLQKATESILAVYRTFGYNVTEEMVNDILNDTNIGKIVSNLGIIVRTLNSAVDKNLENYDPFEFGSKYSIKNALQNLLTPITDTLEDEAVSAFYDSGKMYQSYITPSFITKLMNKFKLTGKELEKFITSEYGDSEWFRDQKADWRDGWKNDMLFELATNAQAQNVFDHKVELNFNKHNYMRTMTDTEYRLSLLAEYYAESDINTNHTPVAWFRVPMLSNKPSSEFIKYYAHRESNYKDVIVGGTRDTGESYGLYGMVVQEISRIQTVLRRNYSKKHPKFIKNWDTNGRKFCYFPFLNPYIDSSANAGKARTLLDEQENDKLAELLQNKINGVKPPLTAEQEGNLTKLLQKAIYNHMDRRAQQILDEWENLGILEEAKKIKNIAVKGLKTDEVIRERVENFIWNDTYMSKNILQLTVGDIAFYKDAEDLQKRLAQLHAPGIRARVDATDYKGVKVSADGMYRTIILKDFNYFISNVVANISEVFDRKIAAAKAAKNDKQAKELEILKDALVRPRTYNPDGTVKDEGGKYWNINVADAQGFSSPTSYRKKAFMFGKWSLEAEEVYQSLIKGEYDHKNLNVAFQPLKPFVYTHLKKDVGVENSPITKMPVPFQAKNAEYLLIMADAMIMGEEAKSGKLSRPNILRAVYRIMEDSAYDGRTYDEKGNIKDVGTYNGKGIDTVQFESAIKSGLQAPIDLNSFLEKPNGEEAAYKFIKDLIYSEKVNEETGEIVRVYNKDTYVHEAPFEDYCLQQEVPEHFKDHEQAQGSQERMIIPSDLDIYIDPNREDRDAEDNLVYYEWIEPDGTPQGRHRKVTAKEFKREYEETIAAGIEESLKTLREELHIDAPTKKERNIALSKILQREILSSPRYGVDLMQACSVDKETGEFRIPKGDPIQSKRIEQLINSIIKNRVNKQKISGGPIVQVSNFGFSKKLHIRFKARSGGLLMLEEEFVSTDKYKTYDEYKKAEQAGIAYFEVLIPMWSKDLFEKFSNADGTIDIEAIEACCPELLEMISYRIPTEDKYSIAPMKAVGFTPREAGEAIIQPYEITEIDDSDFDVDKRYVMRRDIPIKRKARKEVYNTLFNETLKGFNAAIAKNPEFYKKFKAKYPNKSKKEYIAEQVNLFLDNPQEMRNVDSLMQSLWDRYKKIGYYADYPTSGKKFRDNKIISMTWAVLTHERMADQILNPGGFDAPKKMGYMVSAYKSNFNKYSWAELEKMSISDLKDLSYQDKDLTFVDVQVQFYKQNSAAASLIGVFAVNKVAHAVLESDGILVAIDEICGEQPFTIGDTTFGDPKLDGKMELDAQLDRNGNRIGKTLGSLVSASADAVKDPILNLMNINMATAGMLNAMLRLGMTFNEAAMFLSQDVIGKLLNEFNKRNLSKYVTLDTIIDEWLSDFESDNEAMNGENINNLTTEEMIEGLKPIEVYEVTEKEVEEDGKTKKIIEKSEERKTRDTIDYKVVKAFQKIKSITEVVRKPTFATRFNSISSAVGPQIIDNLIMERKRDDFKDSAGDTHLYIKEQTKEGYEYVNVDIDDIFADHPILGQFAKTLDLAKTLFEDMPAGHEQFRNLLNELPKNVADVIYRDKKLFGQLSEFYQSYLLIASGIINPAKLTNYIEGFPKWFQKEKIKEKYPDNALIQAINLNVTKATNRPYLQVQITGVDEQRKEELINAWTDLHKKDPELSQRLFNYCFFRGGIGFTPKTFMSLVSTYIKERLSVTKSDGTKVTYVDTYRKFPKVVIDLVIDQFIRNNWNESKLVPLKGGKGTHYIVNYETGKLTVDNKADYNDLADVKYMRTTANKQTYLWKRVTKTDDKIVYQRVDPLGNNGEYMEMSTKEIKEAMTKTTMTKSDLAATDKKEKAPMQDIEDSPSKSPVSDTETSKNITKLAEMIMDYQNSIGRNPSKEDTIESAQRAINNPKQTRKYMQNVFKNKGIILNEDEIINELKKYCD